MIAQKPDLVRVMLGIHQKATEFAATDKDAMVAMASSKLGQKKEAIEASVPNVELTWKPSRSSNRRSMPTICWR